jgi:molecular chaperone GrpE (heat shock protein)
MTPLDPALLGEARKTRDRLLDLQHELERARADYNDVVRRLNAHRRDLTLAVFQQVVEEVLGAPSSVLAATFEP